MRASSHSLASAVGQSLDHLNRVADWVELGAGAVFDVKKVRKRQGGIREIYRPTRLLQPVLDNLHRSISGLGVYDPPPHVHGFVQGRSTISNTRPHLGAPCVLKIDLEDFFPSISSEQVETLFLSVGFEEKPAHLLTRLVTVERKLPIGFSTSPLISNMVFLSTDRKIARYASDRGLAVTRYVDDIAFSPDPTDQTAADISEILLGDGWSVNRRKTRFMRQGRPQYVTGLYVGRDDGPFLPRPSKRRMRAIMHIIKKFGYETFMEEFGGVEQDMFPAKLRGLGCYFAAIEPDLGFALLRELDEHVPDFYSSPDYELDV